MAKLNIAIDIDGVVLDFNRAWQDFASKLMNVHVEQLSDSYNLHERFGLTKSLASTVWQRFLNDGAYAHIAPYTGAKEWLESLIDEGHNILFVTAISPELEGVRRQNLNDISDKIGSIPIEFTGSHCAGHTKVDVLSKFKPDALIDDQLYNLKHGADIGVQHLIWIDNRDSQFEGIHEDDLHPGIRNNWESIATMRLDYLKELSFDFNNSASPSL